MDCENQLSAAEFLFENSQLDTVVTDCELKCLWANKMAISHFPTLAMPDGLLDLVKGADIKSLIKALRSSTPFTTAINYEPFNDIKASFIPLMDHAEFCGCLVVLRSRENAGVNMDRSSIESAISAFSNGYRMPLTIIFSTLGLMVRRLGDSRDDTLRNYLRLITQNCYRILRLSNSLSDISRYRSGAGEISVRNGDVCRFLNGLCSAVSVLTSSVDVPFEAEIPERSILLLFDPDKLSVALLNIVSNSCKYTRTGNEIRLKLKELDRQVVITISDKGQGIDAEKLKFIFNPYYTYDPEGKRYGGVGLGLSLVKYIVAMHSGTVAVQSVKGVGTTVAISLPLVTDGSLPDYTAESGADYLADRFSSLYVELSDICKCPMP